jgi:hypothetical protein
VHELHLAGGTLHRQRDDGYANLEGVGVGRVEVVAR